jgi:aquaporin Z
MRKYLAEMVGTFVLVVGGVGSAVIAGDEIGKVGISLAFGLSLLAMAYAIGPISGCHINPAVTLGLAVTGKLPGKDVPGYLIGQVIGAVLGAAVVLLIAQGQSGGYDAGAGGLGANGFGAHSPDGYGLMAVFFAEVVLTFFLVFTVLGATDLKAPAGFAGLPIGFVLALIHLVGIPISNTSVNPARSLGPALFVGGWAIGQLWVFILAPLIGAVVAALVFEAVNIRERRPLTSREVESATPGDVRDRRVQTTHRPAPSTR